MSKRRKELKAPDEFVHQGSRVLDWIADREMWFLGLIGALLIAIVGTYGVRAFLSNRTERNFAVLDSALKIASAPVGPRSVSSLEELESIGEEDDLHFETEDEKWEALQAKLIDIEPRLSTDAAKWMASFYHGEAAYRLEEQDQAIAGYEKYANLVAGDDFLYPLALYNLGVAKMDAGQYEAALADLGKAFDARVDAGALGGSILVAKALCQARLGRTEAAKITLEQIDTDYTVVGDALGSAVQQQALALGIEGGFGVSFEAPEKAEPEAAPESAAQ